MYVAPVQDDQTWQQQGLMVVVAVMRAPSYASGQQDTPFPLVMEHQGQQRHHQEEDDGAADDGVGDAGVVAQTVVQCHKVLAWSFCRNKMRNKMRMEDGEKVGWVVERETQREMEEGRKVKR